MNVLMVPEFFPPVMGGVAQHAASLSKALADEGHNVSVLTLGWKGLKEYERMKNFEVFRISGLFQKTGLLYGNANYRFHPPVPDPLLVKKIAKYIRKLRPDVIHCHGWIVYSLLKIRKRFNIPLILTLHDYGLICPTRTVYRNGASCSAVHLPTCLSCSQAKVGMFKAGAMCWALLKNKSELKLVDQYIAVSNWVKDAHEKLINIPEEKIKVIHNFFGLEEQSEKPEKASLPDDFILFVGAMKYEKGIDALLKAYRKLNTQVKLLLIGMKRPGYSFQKEDGVILLENQPRHVVMEAWQRCRFGVVPSVWPEPCPTVALEAMACGKAVVASDVGGLRDIVLNGETGILVPPGDVHSLAEAMKTLLANAQLAWGMGKKGQERLKGKFTIEQIVGNIEKVYETIAGSK